jgi:hypothetical protein
MASLDDASSFNEGETGNTLDSNKLRSSTISQSSTLLHNNTLKKPLSSIQSKVIYLDAGTPQQNSRRRNTPKKSKENVLPKSVC